MASLNSCPARVRNQSRDSGNLRRAFILYGRYKVAWAVREDSSLKTWRDAVEWAKQHPGQLTFGHPGVGSTPNLVMFKIAAREGFTFRTVPFAGDAPSVTALLGGHVVMVGGSSSSFAGYV